MHFEETSFYITSNKSSKMKKSLCNSMFSCCELLKEQYRVFNWLPNGVTIILMSLHDKLSARMIIFALFRDYLVFFSGIESETKWHRKRTLDLDRGTMLIHLLSTRILYKNNPYIPSFDEKKKTYRLNKLLKSAIKHKKERKFHSDFSTYKIVMAMSFKSVNLCLRSGPKGRFKT